MQTATYPKRQPYSALLAFQGILAEPMPESSLHPTDALANERTFLAYVRTALAFVAFGFVIARFALFAREISAVAHIAMPSTHLSTLFGTAMAAVGVLIALYGAYRYASALNALRKGGTHPMPPVAAYAISLVVAIIGGIVAFELFSFRR